MIQMGKIIRQLRKQQKLTQKELAEGIVSESVMSRIENGLTEPGLAELHALFERLGKTLQPFEIIVPNKEYVEWKNKAETTGIRTVLIAEGEYFKDIREAMGLSQEQFSSDVYARETISNIEHGRTPQRKKIQHVLEKQGASYELYYGYVEASEYEVYELVEEYRCLAAEDRTEAKELLKKIKEVLDGSVSVNRQFLESSELIYRRKTEEITVGEALAALEKCLRYTMPEYDGTIYRIPHRQETVILEEIVNCMRAVQRTEAAEALDGIVKKKSAKKLKLS